MDNSILQNLIEWANKIEEITDIDAIGTKIFEADN